MQRLIFWGIKLVKDQIFHRMSVETQEKVRTIVLGKPRTIGWYARRVALVTPPILLVASAYEKSPFSGYYRMVMMLPEDEKQIGDTSSQTLLAQLTKSHVLVPSHHPVYKRVTNVVTRLDVAIREMLNERSNESVWDASQYLPDEWRIFIISSNEFNAFVLPNGDIFLNSEVLNYIRNDDELATILSHEIGHKLARHTAAKLTFNGIFFLLDSFFMVTLALVLPLPVFIEPLINELRGLVIPYLIQLPYSRSLELEADYISVLLMSKACYNATAAAELWDRLSREKKLTKADRGLMDLMSTHPHPSLRAEKISSWRQEAAEIFNNNATCRTFLDDFHRVEAYYRIHSIRSK